MTLPQAVKHQMPRGNWRQGARLGGLRSFHSRVVELEREHAQAQAQALLLVALQADILRIASLRTPDEAIAQLLRSACDTLGFTRGIYFGVGRERGIEARWQIDGGADVVPSREAAKSSRDDLLPSVLRGAASNGCCTLEEAAPLHDVRAPYVVSALTQATTTLGILYVDGYVAGTMPQWQPELVHALTKAASVSIGNSALLTHAHELASRDALTGLLNRRALAERLPIELALCRDYGHSLTYLMIDIDDLKHVNDSRGHAQGDAVLKRVAATLTRYSRAGDVVGRYGGDEFVMMLPAVHRELAQILGTRLASELRSEGLSCSIGAALFPGDACDEPGLTLAADRALYTVKAAGKNGFSFA